MQNVIKYPSLKVKSIYKVVDDDQSGFLRNGSTTDQIFAFRSYWRKYGNKVRQYISYS
jgi:hypothetical protein